eukprot:gene49-4299_t
MIKTSGVDDSIVEFLYHIFIHYQYQMKEEKLSLLPYLLEEVFRIQSEDLEENGVSSDTFDILCDILNKYMSYFPEESQKIIVPKKSPNNWIFIETIRTIPKDVYFLNLMVKALDSGKQNPIIMMKTFKKFFGLMIEQNLKKELFKVYQTAYSNLSIDSLSSSDIIHSILLECINRKYHLEIDFLDLMKNLMKELTGTDVQEKISGSSKKSFCPNGLVDPKDHFYIDPSEWNEKNLIPHLKIGHYPLLVAPSQSECHLYACSGDSYKCTGNCGKYICAQCACIINDHNFYGPIGSDPYDGDIFCDDCHQGSHECFIIISEHGCSFAKNQYKNPENLSIVEKFIVDLPISSGVQSQFLKKKRNKYISKIYIKNVTKKAIELWGNFTKPINLHIGITKLLNNHDFTRKIEENLHPINCTKYEINYGFQKGLDEHHDIDLDFLFYDNLIELCADHSKSLELQLGNIYNKKKYKPKNMIHLYFDSIVLCYCQYEYLKPHVDLMIEKSISALINENFMNKEEWEFKFPLLILGILTKVNFEKVDKRFQEFGRIFFDAVKSRVEIFSEKYELGIIYDALFDLILNHSGYSSLNFLPNFEIQEKSQIHIWLNGGYLELVLSGLKKCHDISFKFK